MKKFLPVILLVLAFCFSCNAASITITDPNFRTWLVNHGYSACLSGNQFDSACASNIVYPGDTLNMSNAGLTDINGIEYIRWYGVGAPPAINLSHNNFTTYPARTLYFKGCGQDAHYTWGFVDFSYNNVTVLDLNAAPMNAVDLSHNQINTVIRDTLANQCYLHYLDLSYNNLDSLPKIQGGWCWPYSCSGMVFKVRHNHLTKKLNLQYVNVVDCGANQIDSFIQTSGFMYSLTCDSNQLKYVYFTGHSCTGATYLDCHHNQLTELAAVPFGVATLNCSDNQLTSIPYIPQTGYLSNLDCSNNPNLTCIPNLPNVSSLTLNFSNTAINCLPRLFPNCNYNGSPNAYAFPECTLFNNPNGCPQYANMSGFVYADTIQNCRLDASEKGIYGALVWFKQNGNLLDAWYSGNGGHYSFDEIDTGAYQIEIDTNNQAVAFKCPDSLYYTVHVDSQELYTTGFDFGARCKPGVDIEAPYLCFGVLHPGTPVVVSIGADDASINYGMHCANGTPGTVIFNYSGSITYQGPASGSLPPSSVTGNTFIWNIADWGAVNPGDFALEFITNTTAVNGEPVCFYSAVTPATDNNPVNNTNYVCGTVLTAYDPNMKEVYPAGIIDTSTQWLTYTIHFQNTGNAPADHVVVKDTLSNNVDWTTARLLTASHKNVTEISAPGIITFNFPNINLVDSNVNVDSSKGYVQYKVKLKDYLPIGTVIANTASIYFDFNAPVMTNSANDTIGIAETTAVEKISSNESLYIFPNPATEQLNVLVTEKQLGNQLQMLNTLGECALKKQVESTSFTLPLKALAKGVYYLQITDGRGNNIVRKVIIQ